MAHCRKRQFLSSAVLLMVTLSSGVVLQPSEEPSLETLSLLFGHGPFRVVIGYVFVHLLYTGIHF
jgi:hypothetical protein